MRVGTTCNRVPEAHTMTRKERVLLVALAAVALGIVACAAMKAMEHADIKTMMI